MLNKAKKDAGMPYVADIGGEKVQVTNAQQESEAARIIKEIPEKYGVEISTSKGVQAVKDHYDKAPESVRTKVKGATWLFAVHAGGDLGHGLQRRREQAARGDHRARDRARAHEVRGGRLLQGDGLLDGPHDEERHRRGRGAADQLRRQGAGAADLGRAALLERDPGASVEEDDAVDFLEVFAPTTLEDYRARIYEDPGTFIR